ncbi:hypothetical protein BDN67DRAFT_972905 [Paxillus ammoniavirescens]|nr:hypothetical protein BDN67DRAFT_972905 [Paxillus ammoniavirescens]
MTTQFDRSMVVEMEKDACRHQTAAAEVSEQILDLGHLDTIWTLLDVSEQKRHILQGLQNACKGGTFIESYSDNVRKMVPMM